MKHLVVFAHPNSSSLNAALKEQLVSSLIARSHQVQIRDLYHIGFDPVLSLQDMEGQKSGQVPDDVLIEQEFIDWADSLIFIHPIWWTGLPAIMKGYIDRVFSYGFAYRYDQGQQKGLLTGKQITIINTHGKSTAQYRENGIGDALIRTSDQGIYQYCGLQVNTHLYLDQADRADDSIIRQWKNQIQQVVATIKAIPTVENTTTAHPSTI